MLVAGRGAVGPVLGRDAIRADLARRAEHVDQVPAKVANRRQTWRQVESIKPTTHYTQLLVRTGSRRERPCPTELESTSRRCVRKRLASGRGKYAPAVGLPGLVGIHGDSCVGLGQ